MTPYLSFALFIALLAAAPAAPGATDSDRDPFLDTEAPPFPSSLAARQWTHKFGATMEAELVEVEGGRIGLRPARGRTIRLQRSDLSAEDNAYLNDLLPAAYQYVRRQHFEKYYDVHLFGKVTSVSGDEWDSPVAVGAPMEAIYRVDTSVQPTVGSDRSSASFGNHSGTAPNRMHVAEHLIEANESHFVIYDDSPHFGSGYSFDTFGGSVTKNTSGLFNVELGLRLWSSDNSLLDNLEHPMREFPVSRFDESAYMYLSGRSTDEDDGPRASVRGEIEAYSVQRSRPPNSIGSKKTWTNAEGNSFEGELVNLEHNAAVLRRLRDGREFTVPVESLSNKDQAFLHQLRAAARRGLGKPN